MWAQSHYYDSAPEVTVTDESRVGESLDADATADAPESEQDEAIEKESAQEEAPATRSEATDEFWEEVGVDPIKLALPRDVVGYTLRAYRPASQVTLSASEAETDEDDPFTAHERARAAEAAARAEGAEELTEEELAELALAESGEAERDQPERAAEGETGEAPEPSAEELTEEELAEAEQAEEQEDQEVPVFLSHRGKLLLFATPEALVSFVRSDAEHDLRQLDTWPTLVKRISPEDVVPTEQDTYELDLVVENLRAGHDAWDPILLISAGEVARDLGHALRLEPAITALAPGSPLDDLDEALRAVAAGGISGRFARRRLRRIGAQQASLGWRTVIGKISAATDWRD
ncbi:MAG TPA: DNA primase [Natronosporangium sp.]|nr:DNA primase [Natronosporangium sp.]